MSRILSTQHGSTADPAELAERYRTVRLGSQHLCAPLEPEDFVVQSMPDVSPTRWHIAHTTWFFENFVLAVAYPDYIPHDSDYAFLFNSYYNKVGEQFARPQRGILSRPTVREILSYRAAVDQRMSQLFDEFDCLGTPELAAVIEIGLHHEQQHQELMLTDIKHVFSCNPLQPRYWAAVRAEQHPPNVLEWVEFEGGIVSIGHAGPGFSYDNERPRHETLVPPFALASRSVTNIEYGQFIDDGGYSRADLWLADGWSVVRDRGWTAPLYWVRDGQSWMTFTLSGSRELEPHEPVTHLSYYEADAYARWAGAQLPTEATWETAACSVTVAGNFAERQRFHPQPAAGPGLQQMFGDVWEWTASPYIAYPGYRAPAGALGEYNGKFMCNQFVLRGGSCATPAAHVRPTYRNFFYPDTRWQFSGIRLCKLL